MTLSALIAQSSAAADWFIRGDADGSGVVNVSDAVRILRHLFVDGNDAPLACLDAADADNSGYVGMTDAVYLLRYLFLHGFPPPQSIFGCGWDAGPKDGLDCVEHTACNDLLHGLLDAAEAVVFLVDRSSSVADSGGLVKAKKLVEVEITSFREDGDLGLVIFDKSVLRLPAADLLLAGTAANKEDLLSFLQSTTVGAGTCPEPGFLAALAKLRTSQAREKVIVYFGDCGATCPGNGDELMYLNPMLNKITQENTGGVRIHCVAVEACSPDTEALFRQLAEQNGGEFRELTGLP